VSSTNSVLEGDDGVTDTATPTVRLGNYHQISDKVARVSGTQRSVEHAGRDDELDYQVSLKGKELKRDMETILLANQGRNAGAPGTPRGVGAVLSWILQHQQGHQRLRPDRGRRWRFDPHGRLDPCVYRSAAQGVLQSVWINGGDARHDHGRRLQQAAVLDLHRPLDADGGGEVEEDRGIGRCLRVRLRHAQGRPEPLHAHP
jgi:hypothetical protein